MSLSPQQKQTQKRLNRQSTILSLLAIALFGGISYYIAKDSASGLEAQLNKKVEVDRENLQLHVLRAVDQKEITSIHPNDDLLIAVDTRTPIHTALMLSVNEEPAQLISEGARVPPGKSRLLAKGDDRIHYLVKTTDHRLRFCLLTASSSDELHRLLSNPQSQWPRIASNACVNLSD